MRYSIADYVKAGELSAKAENERSIDGRLVMDARISLMFNAESSEADRAMASAAFDNAYMATRHGHS